MVTPLECSWARREGMLAAAWHMSWTANPFTHPLEMRLRVEWHLGWWEMQKSQACILADAWQAGSGTERVRLPSEP